MIDTPRTRAAATLGSALLGLAAQLGCASTSTSAASPVTASGTTAGPVTASGTTAGPVTASGTTAGPVTAGGTTAGGVKASGPTLADVLAAASPADFRAPDPENTLYLELASGRVVMELAPRFAPRHVANVKALAREGYYDGLAIVRVHENYVVQWADPDGQRPIRAAQRTLPAELERPAAELPFTVLPERDAYADQIGFSEGFPAAREPTSGLAWLAHCYGMLGAGRDVAPDSGGGAELYVVIGHSPRHLDRNVTLFGRVLSGMERLTALPRGTAPLGFYEKPEQRIPIQRVRVAADVPPAERTELEVLRIDTPTFQTLIESRRNRREDWFVHPAGHIDLCNVPLVVRPKSASSP